MPFSNLFVIKLICIFSTSNFLILCNISAEFYLNYKFIIIKIIMYSNCVITSFKKSIPIVMKTYFSEEKLIK